MNAQSDMVRIGFLGAGGIVRGCHLPGFRRIPGVTIAAVADPVPDKAAELAQEAGIPRAFTNPSELLEMDGLDAVVVATPNDEHPGLVTEAVQRGLHVLCEKPLAVDLPEAERMVQAADSAEIVHMTAFTYRFVPSMRWLIHRVQAGEIGKLHHFRSQRFQDMGDRALGWRQEKARAGTGEIGDMMAHRIDYAHALAGPISGLFGRLFTLHSERRDARTGQIQPSDVDDWASLIVDFDSGCTGVFESSKVAWGYGNGLKSWDLVELNGEIGSFKYMLHEPNTLWHSPQGGRYEAQPVPEAFLKTPESPRDTAEGDASQTFRYDQAWEFISAIREGRAAQPDFHDGMAVQKVIDAALRSHEEGRWMDVPSGE